MERVRDNYNYQTENLKGIRQYGSTQLQGVRDQYYEQVSLIYVVYCSKWMIMTLVKISIFHQLII